MKNLIALLIVLVFGVSASYATNPNKEKLSPLALEVKQLLVNPWTTFEDNEQKASVFFILNDNNEIVVINVESENPDVDKFVKTRLNYKKIKSTMAVRGRIYKMPLRIVK